MQPYVDEIATVKAVAAGTTYGATESVFDYMAAAVGLVDVTPEGYRNAAANESDPAPGDVNDFEELLRSRHDRRARLQHPDRGLDPRAAPRTSPRRADVPVVEVTETVPAGGPSLRRLAGRPADGTPSGPRWMTARLSRHDHVGRTPAAPTPAIEFRAPPWPAAGAPSGSTATFTIPRGAARRASSGPTARARPRCSQVVLGLLPVSRGSVEVLGETPHRGDPRIGYVPAELHRHHRQRRAGPRPRRPRPHRRRGGASAGSPPTTGTGSSDTLDSVGAGAFADRRMSTALRRPAATRGHRPGPGLEARPAAARRAPRQPRHAQPARGRRAARASSASSGT